MAKNMFEQAAAVVAPAKKPGKKDEKRRVFMKNLEPYALIGNLMKSLETVQETLKDELHGLMKSEFKLHGKDSRPKNFRGFEGETEASMELRKRATTSKLTPEERAALDEHKIPYGKEEALPERYFFNPEILNDPKLMQKISKALEGISGLPEQVIMLQKSEPTYVVTDETVNEVFKKGLASDLMGIVTTLAIKPSVGEQNIAKSLDKVKEFLSAKKKNGSAELLDSLKKSLN